jgi:hypothetical protein
MSERVVMANAETGTSFEVESGIYRRRICPISVPYDGESGGIHLSRPDHEKNTLAQVEETPGGRRLWWLIDKLAEGEKYTYRLHRKDEPIEHATRVRLRPSAFGWRATVRKEFIAELLTPADGSPKFSFRPDGKRNSTLSMSGGSADMHRRRVADPVVVEGPVFASLAVDYKYVDRLDRTLGVERHYFRVFDGPSSMLLVDWSVKLAATSGPISLDNGNGWTPAVMIDPAGESLVAAESGWKNVDVVDRPGALVSLTVDDRTTSLMIRSDSAGFPFRWTVKGERNLVARPDFTEKRLATGETAAFHLRLASMTGKRALYIHDRYMDFDQPPRVKRMKDEG